MRESPYQNDREEDQIEYDRTGEPAACLRRQIRLDAMRVDGRADHEYAADQSQRRNQIAPREAEVGRFFHKHQVNRDVKRVNRDNRQLRGIKAEQPEPAERRQIGTVKEQEPEAAEQQPQN